MKKAISLLMVVLILTAPAIIPAAGAPADKISYVKKAVRTYLFDEDDPVELTCLFRTDLPSVPYFSIEDFLNQLFVKKVSVKHSGDVYTITNDGFDMVIDAAKDTVHFDKFEDFTSVNAKPFLDEEKAEYLSEEYEYTFIGEYKPADIDFGKYDIDITASDGKVYLPYCTLNDLFADNYRLVVYEDGELRFTEAMSDDFIEESHGDDAETHDRAFTEFTYNELCFVFDNCYGTPSSAKISESIAEMGFDKAIETYDATTAKARELLHSERTVDFCMGLLFLESYFSDGGHTLLSSGYLLSLLDSDYSDFKDLLIDMILNNDEIDYETLLSSQTDLLSGQMDSNTCASAKRDAYDAFDLIDTWDDAKAYRSGDTVIFEFDEFKDAVVEPFKWTLDYAAEHHAKRFIVDLSTNYGGSTSVSIYMLSIMCGVVGPNEWISLTDNEIETLCTVDKNLDGKFDSEDDKVKYDFEFAILTTKHSYSCSNLMSCCAQDNGIPVIGETSGGGCCNITVRLFPDGTLYTTAGMMKALRADGSDNDSGAKPDFELPGTDDDYKGFFDINRINAAVDSFYSGSTVESTEPETDAVTEATETASASIESDAASDSKSINYWLRFLLIALIAAVTIIIIFIIMLCIKRKKAKNADDRQPPAVY